MNGPTVRHNTAQRRYELVDGATVLGFAQYSRAGDTVTISHTEIAPEHAGQGHGATLAKGVLEMIRRDGARVAPVCRFLAGYIDRHGEYADLVAD